MSRKLVYLNGQNESLTFETGPYLIVKIEGLGIPNVDRQEQKSPYQDGTTYIDSLLQNRDIVVELAITKPNDFPNIALYRRELSQRLTPKYGLGDLNYTDEDGNEYTIRAVVSSMVFPNKDYRDPYMRAMVTFTACDPYWLSVTDTTISLPTSENSSNSSFSTAGYNPQIIQKSNDEFLGFLIRDLYLTLICESSATGATWAALSTVESDQVSGFSATKQSDDTIRIVYTRVTDGYIYQRTSSDSGATWSARTAIVSSSTNGIMRIKQINDGSFIMLFSNGTNIYKTSSATGATWAAPTVTNLPDDDYFDVFVLADGSYSYAGAMSTKVDYRQSTNAITWTLVSNVITSTNISGVAIDESNNFITVYYTQGSPASSMYKKASINGGSAWSDASSLGLGPNGYFGIILQSNNAIRIVYTTGFPWILITYTRSVTPVPAVNTGDVPAPILVTFQGPSTNPRIINQNTLEYIRLNTTLAAADSFEVDTSFGNKTVKLIQSGIEVNGIAFLDIGSTFFQLERGSNTVYYEDDAVLSTATASLEFTERYSGL